MGSCTWWERFLQTRSRKREKQPGPFPFPKPGWQDRTDLENLLFKLKRHIFWNKVLPDGCTFLSWAVEFEDEEIVKWLLDTGANPNIRDTVEPRMTPLIKALKLGNMTMVDLLKEKDKSSMHILADEADDIGEEQALDLARKLLGQGYELNKRDLKGQNPVHIACRKGRTRLVEEFLHPDYGEQNAFVHQQDNSGKTPMQYAIDNEDIVKLLIQHGADLSDVQAASLFKIRESKPVCVQLTSNRRAHYQTLLLISDNDEARELWNPQPGHIKLRLFDRGSKIPDFHSFKVKEDPVLRRGYCQFFQSKRSSQPEQHARLQSWFKAHVTGLTHVVNIDPYLRKEKGPLMEIIREMDQEVSSGLARIEQSIRELLQIEIAWISISEAKSIKRLTWITFIFLPLMLASSLFGMNINLLKDNPNWRWFLPIGVTLVLLTFALWLLFDWYYPVGWDACWDKTDLSESDEDVLEKPKLPDTWTKLDYIPAKTPFYTGSQPLHCIEAKTKPQVNPAVKPIYHDPNHPDTDVGPGRERPNSLQPDLTAADLFGGGPDESNRLEAF
ncbi:ankyrin [Aspergillus novofumigatus IBT 16806]|uniref:Ankyrin n=1 Tax=Aspergillus novofumigatus (strain IBT 16806) TaxID=1392255 RepID=A0A2I1C416_ASPN1|nr:ankyrin [Aspergillus novofumigatus IBT 16806]PKX92377.1 ankyrin [Aspergillus novofumigatus IBT 16806]